MITSLDPPQLDMPALFDVPGWSVPSAPVSTQRQSKKRKLAASSEEQELLRNAQANLDKLVDSLGGSFSDDAGDRSSKKKKKKKLNKPTQESKSQPPHRHQGPLPQEKPHGQPEVPTPAVDSSTNSEKGALSSKRAKKKKHAKHVVQPTDTPEQSAVAQDTSSLTPLQQSLRKSLDGARFRFVFRFMEIQWVNLCHDLDC